MYAPINIMTVIFYLCVFVKYRFIKPEEFINFIMQLWRHQNNYGGPERSMVLTFGHYDVIEVRINSVKIFFYCIIPSLYSSQYIK